VQPRAARAGVPAGPGCLGRVLDGLAAPIDGRGPLRGCSRVPLVGAPIPPLGRRPIERPFAVGVPAIDGLLTLGEGARVGLFAGSGVGKSTLLGRIAQRASADVCVVALIGERGREVREFLEKNLGEEGLRRSVVVVATSEQPPLIRLKGAMIAATIAEYFREQGKDVLFMVDSVTRLAMAQREVGLAIGEPPATKGYTPSVFALLPQILERAGNSDKGTITGIFAVLVDSDDMDEPIADAVRGIIDGHIVLSRRLAHRNHFPAIDVLESISRCMPDVVAAEHLAVAGALKDCMAAYRENEDLIQIGAYAGGSSERIDKAIQLRGPLELFLRQGILDKYQFEESLEKVKALAGLASAPRAQAGKAA
jgi:flagellum-specific ATP synthase